MLHLEGARLSSGAAECKDAAAALGGVAEEPRRQHILAHALRPCSALKVKEEDPVHCWTPCIGVKRTEDREQLLADVPADANDRMKPQTLYSAENLSK